MEGPAFELKMQIGALFTTHRNNPVDTRGRWLKKFVRLDRAPKHSKAAQPDPIQDLTDSEYSSDRGVLSPDTNSLMGKARTAGRHQVLVKPHWSQLGSLT